jgi:hypothetical protein
MPFFNYSTTLATLAFAFILQSDACPQRSKSAPDAGVKPSPVASPTPRTPQRQSTQVQGEQKVVPVDVSANRKASENVQPLASGTWGGAHIRLDVGERGATLEYDCAHGTIDEKILPDAEGGFDVRGTHEAETGGAISGISVANEETNDTTNTNVTAANAHPARYVGLVKGDVMTLSVTHADTKQSFGNFTLKRRESARLFKCLQ